MSLLNGVQMTDISDAIGSANFSGMSSCSSYSNFGKCTCLRSFLPTADPWITDSGASDHMTHDASLFSSYHTLPKPSLITLPNGYKVQVTHYGSVTLHPNLIIHNVLHVPCFKYHLLSIQKLCSQLDCHCHFLIICLPIAGPFNEEASCNWQS